MPDPIKSIRTVAEAYAEMHSKPAEGKITRPVGRPGDTDAAGRVHFSKYANYASEVAKAKNTPEAHELAAIHHRNARNAHAWERPQEGQPDLYAHHDKMYSHHLKQLGLSHEYMSEGIL